MGTLGTSLLETASQPPAQIYPDNPNLKSKWTIPPHQMLRFRCGLVTTRRAARAAAHQPPAPLQPKRPARRARPTG